LISAKDGEDVWSHTTFDSIDRKALKKLPEEERKKKEVQLRVTSEKVVRDLESCEGSKEKFVERIVYVARFCRDQTLLNF
jgi:hypothetical protein